MRKGCHTLSAEDDDVSEHLNMAVDGLIMYLLTGASKLCVPVSKKEHNPLQQLSLKHFQTRWTASTCTLNSLTLVFFFSFFFCLFLSDWLTCVVRRFHQALFVFFVVMLQLFGLKVRSEGYTWIYIRPPDPPQTEVWMIDRWGVIMGKTATIMPIKHCLLLLFVLLSVYQIMTIMQKAGHHRAASACLFFFFFHVIVSSWSAFVWRESCCGRTGSGLLGARLCSEGDVFQRTSGSIRLSLTNLHFWGEPAPWPGFPQNWEAGRGGWQFSPQGNSLAK